MSLKTSLHGALGSFLKNGVYPVIIRRCDRLRVSRYCLSPTGLNGRAVLS
jgi:hypothetical protein